VAQLVEHLICNQGVAGSNPAGGTIKINDLLLYRPGSTVCTSVLKGVLSLPVFLVSPWKTPRIADADSKCESQVPCVFVLVSASGAQRTCRPLVRAPSLM